MVKGHESHSVDFVSSVFEETHMLKVSLPSFSLTSQPSFTCYVGLALAKIAFPSFASK